MGTIETRSKVPAEGSSPSQENGKVQGSEREKKELKESLGALKSGEEPSVVPENGVGFSSLGSKDLGDDGVVEVVKSRVIETRFSVVGENDCQGLADSEMNGVSSLLKMRESGRSTVFSHGGGCGGGNDGAERGVARAADSLGVAVEESRDGKKSEEEEKDEDCDGKIVTIDVPIAETSENMDVEMEDLSAEGYGFSVGDFVWGKIKSHPWWPGRIYNPSDASDLALKLKQKNRLLVAYFGDGTFAWCHPSQLKPFEENFDDMMKQSSTRAFVNAVHEAVNEVGWLLHIKMSLLFVPNKSVTEFAPPLAKNSGLKEGVVVPENGIEMFSGVVIEPVELLSQVKQIAEIINIASFLELEILKAQLSAFYLSRGGYKLSKFEDPQPIPGLEDSLVDETVDLGNGMSAVEPPVQGPFEDDYTTLPLSPKVGGLRHSPGLSGNRSTLRRKQKSIAEILGEDRDVCTKNKEVNATDEVINAIGSTGRKKRKGGEDTMLFKPVQKRKELVINANTNVPGAENDGSKEEKEASGNETISMGSQKETYEWKTKEHHEKGSLSRERKKSKYLSPPFTTPIWGHRKGDLETESPKISSEALESEGMARAGGQLSPSVLKSDGEACQEKISKEVVVDWELSNSSNYHTKEDDEKNTIDPAKVQVPLEGVLSNVCYAAINPQIPAESTSFEKIVDFISAFRSALFQHGSYYKVYNKRPAGRKRNKPESELGMLMKDQNETDHISPNHNSQPRKRRKLITPGWPRGNGAPETKIGKKGTDENASAAALYVSFWPGSTLPSKSDLIKVYSKFGALNEAETEMFRTNYTARVCFLRTSDAESALSHSQNLNPFGSSEATFQLQYSSAGSKAGEHGERSKSRLSSSKKKGKTPAKPSVSLPLESEASKLKYIKQKLQGLTSMVETSDGKSPDMKTELLSRMKGLFEDVNKMIESSAS